ncbi:unnamed protein product [Microthlaspi erraticum]|uniref:Aspartic peptidase DDI1-type domain-containing protein n=1 Tax=Microthlaspi erraticum TaxID=1685480 RepID=A0A6D2KK21_9BRAS|nr:unnamed protein product [Microthlaspi erraticum]
MSTHQINLLTSPTFLPKVKDQGKFTLPCTLGHIELDNALVDSGASINLISLTMAEKIGITWILELPALLREKKACYQENIPRSRGSKAASQEETNGVCHIGDGTEPPKEVHVRIEPGTQEEVEKPPEEPRVYEPKIPYRNVLSQPKKEKEQAKLKDLVSQLSVRLPFIDACQIIPSLRKYMKAILTSNVSLEEGAMMITKECSAILQNRMPEKLNDPGVLFCLARSVLHTSIEHFVIWVLV